MIQSLKIKYKINETDEEISQMSKYKFKRIVEKKVNSFVFETLKVKASSHSKSLQILSEVQNQNVQRRKAYLKDNTLPKNDGQLLFKLR